MGQFSVIFSRNPGSALNANQQHHCMKRPKGAIKSKGFPKYAKPSPTLSKPLPPRKLYQERLP